MKFLLVKYGREYFIAEGKCWAGSGGWLRFISEKFSELGYEKIEPLSIGFSASFILDDSDTEFGKIVGQELWREAMDHNEKIREEMDRTLDEFVRIKKLNEESKK